MTAMCTPTRCQRAFPVEWAVPVDDVEESGFPRLRSSLHTRLYEPCYTHALRADLASSGSSSRRWGMRSSLNGMASASPPANTSAKIHPDSRLASSRRMVATTAMYVTSYGSSWVVGGANR